jgi:hypothetical protein
VRRVFMGRVPLGTNLVLRPEPASGVVRQDIL